MKNSNKRNPYSISGMWVLNENLENSMYFEIWKAAIQIPCIKIIALLLKSPVQVHIFRWVLFGNCIKYMNSMYFIETLPIMNEIAKIFTSATEPRVTNVFHHEKNRFPNKSSKQNRHGRR